MKNYSATWPIKTHGFLRLTFCLVCVIVLGTLFFVGCFGGVISVGCCSQAGLAVRCASEFPKASAQLDSVVGPDGGVIISFEEITPQDRGVITSENNSLAYTNDRRARRTCLGRYVFSCF